MTTATCDNPVIMRSLDRQRAAGAHFVSQEVAVTGDEPLIIDLLPTFGQSVGKHWIVEHFSCVGILARQPQNAGVPICGLYLCPQTTPTETLAQAQAGFNRLARPILLPMVDPAVATQLMPGPSPNVAIAMTMHPGFKATAPAGFFLRVIIVSRPGVNVGGPGPGVGSVVRAFATVVDENDQ